MGKVYQDCPFKFTFPPNWRKTGTPVMTGSRHIGHVLFIYQTDAVNKTSKASVIENPTISSCPLGEIRAVFILVAIGCNLVASRLQSDSCQIVVRNYREYRKSPLI